MHGGPHSLVKRAGGLTPNRSAPVRLLLAQNPHRGRHQNFLEVPRETTAPATTPRAQRPHPLPPLPRPRPHPPTQDPPPRQRRLPLPPLRPHLQPPNPRPSSPLACSIPKMLDALEYRPTLGTTGRPLSIQRQPPPLGRYGLNTVNLLPRTRSAPAPPSQQVHPSPANRHATPLN